MLLPPIQCSLLKGRRGKKDLITVSGPGRGEIVFTLLNEVIAIYVRLIFVDIWGLGFKSRSYGVFGGAPILAMSCRGLCFQDCDEDLLKAILGLLRNLKGSQNMSRV